MISALDSRLSGMGLSAGRGHCVVFLGTQGNELSEQPVKNAGGYL